MTSTVKQLYDKGLLSGAPDFVVNATQYEVIMGSIAYGVAENHSDMDVYGFTIPPKELVFPHLRGDIPGFDDFDVKFSQYQQHHIHDASALSGKGREYDLTIYSITKYCKLLMQNNPNIIDSLFVPDNCVLHMTPVAELIREQRQMFLHKGCWATFKGYAYAQMHKMRTKQPEGKRAELVKQFGYDVKFAYHVVRLLNEVEQILTEQTIDLSRNKEQLKAIRRGEWSLAEVEHYFKTKEAALEQSYQQSVLPAKPDVPQIRRLLMQCLEQHYGSLDQCIAEPEMGQQLLSDLKQLLRRYDR